MVVHSLADEPPLVKAIFNKDVSYVKEHLNTKDSNYQTTDGSGLLHLAAFVGCRETVAALLEWNVRVNKKDTYRWITPLHRACLRDNHEVVEILLDHNASLTERDRNFQTALHVCAAHNSIRCADLLLPKIPNINVSDRQGRPPLHHAVFRGNLELTVLLISHGADVNVCDKRGRRAIHWAAQRGHLQILQALVDANADLTVRDNELWSVIHCAVASDRKPLLDHLLSKHNLAAEIDTVNSSGDTALHVAAYNGCPAALLVLLEFGADLEAKNLHGLTPLHQAAMCPDNEQNLKYLVKKGANVNAQAKDGKSALHYLASYGRTSRARFLIDNGANVNNQDYYGTAPLHIAALHSHVILIKTLVEYGANVNQRNKYGFSSLMLAAYSNHLESLKLLLHYGSDTKHTDSFARSCLHFSALAKSSGSQCTELLIQSGANVHSLDSFGRSPLHYACFMENQPIATCLLQHSAYAASLPDCDGRTPLHYAAASEQEFQSCVEPLLNSGANCMYPDKAKFLPIHYASAQGHNLLAIEILAKSMTPSFLSETVLTSNNFYPTTPFHLAAYFGHADAIDCLRRFCSSIDVRDSKGNTPMHLSTYRGHFGCVKRLLLCNSSIAAGGQRGLTPVHLAAGFGHISCLKYLIAEGVEDADVVKIINEVDNLKKTPLMYAVSSGEEAVAAYLLSLGAQVSPVDVHRCSAMHRVAVIGSEKLCSSLLAYDADVFAKDVHGMTSLHLAAKCGHVGVLRKLLQCLTRRKNVQPILDDWHQSPLHYACYAGHEACVEALLAKCSATVLAGHSFSPAHMACVNGNRLCFELILENQGASVAALCDELKRTPLHVCSLHGHLDMCRFLVGLNVPVNVQDDYGRSPLICAVKNRHVDVADFLLHLGADYGMADATKNTALHYACAQGDLAISDLLLDAIGNLDVINLQNDKLKTALHYAVANGMVSIVEKLLIKGASLALCDENGLTPMYAATPGKNASDCLELLLCLLFPEDPEVQRSSVAPAGRDPESLTTSDQETQKRDGKDNLSSSNQSSDSEYY